MYSLALDVGGTWIKAAVISESFVGPVWRKPIPHFLDQEGSPGDLGRAREIDANSLTGAIDKILAKAGKGFETDGRILVTGQMAGIGFVDENGEAKGPLISWQDTRYHDVAGIVRMFDSDGLAVLGEKIRVGSPILTLAKHPRPEGAYVTSILGFVTGHLAKTRARVVHSTDAGSWAMLDLQSLSWSRIACEITNLGTDMIPKVSQKVIEVAENSGVYCGVGDQQASLLGAALEPGWLSVNLATGCQVSVLADGFSRTAQTRPYFGSEFGGEYIHTVTHLPAGRILAADLKAQRGSLDWNWLATEGLDYLPAVSKIVEGIVEAAARIASKGLPIVFSGGLVQRLPRLQQRIASELGVTEVRSLYGRETALEGLAKLWSVAGRQVFK